MIDKRAPGLSLLDYLWTNYGGLEISNEVNATPANDVLLTEKAIIEEINKQLSLIDTSILLSSVINDNKITLLIKNSKGELITYTDLERGALITDFSKFISTQEDVDNGLASRVGVTCIKLTDSIGQEYLIELPYLSGSESDCIIVTVKDNKVNALLKIDNPNVERSVELSESENGVQAKLIINKESSVNVDKTNDGILVHQTWIDEKSDVKFKAITSNEYFLLTSIDYGTLYFITDIACIFFRNIKYAATEILSDEVKDLLNELPDITNQINNLKESMSTYHTWLEL